MKTWRLLLQKYYGFSVEAVCQSHTLQPARFPEVLEGYQDIMNQNGVALMCLDLISLGMDHEVIMEAIRLLIMLLVREFGNEHLQATIHRYLTSHDSSLYFETIRDLLETLTQTAKREVEGDEDNYEQLNSEVIVLQLIALMCEGNFEANKNLCRQQESNARPVNLLDCLVNYIEPLSRLEGSHITRCILRVNRTILSLIHGPCRGNQEHFVIQTELMSSLNRVMRASRPHASLLTAEWIRDFELEKETIIDIFRTSIDGQGNDFAKNNAILIIKSRNQALN